MHQALYRKWRPRTFDDVCGQEHITSVLRYEAENASFSHAYLFCGSRGTGKTTCAKILAKVVNCEHPVKGNPCGECASCRAIESGAATDILEMDAASNNGVDNIRDIRDEVVYSPSELRYRVYIIDEVHMLSVSAFNALLKTLEEPPEHVIFILATTELQKLPATIISRCQRFDFRRITTEVLMSRLSYISKEEGLELDPDAARMIAKLAQGGMRDAISLLELCAGGQKKITPETVENSVGLTGRDAMLRTVEAISDRNYDALFEQIAQVVRSSKDLTVFWQDLISVYRDLLVVRTTSEASSYLDLTDHETEQIHAIASRFRKETLIYHCKLLEDALFAMQKANSVKRIVAEMTLIRMCDETLDTSVDALLSRVARLEDQILCGSFAAPSKVVTPRREPAPEKPDKETKPPKTENAEAGTESHAPVTKPSSPAPAVLRPLRNWMEVVEKIGRSEPMSAGFLRTAHAYQTEDQKVIVCFGNDFALRQLDNPDAREHLRVSLSSVLRREISPEDLSLEREEKTKEYSVLDELIDSVNGTASDR